jgi:hypothetical protein
MTEPEVFVLADHTLSHVVAQIVDDQWDQPVPDDFLIVAQHERPTLRAIVNSHAHDDAWVPEMLAGRTMAEVGPEAYHGDLLGEDPKASFARLVENACAAASALTDLDRTVHCSFGDFPRP